MILKFNDATELQIQSAQETGGRLEIKAINITPVQLRELFTDQIKTKIMQIIEREQTIAEYEGYTEFYRTEEYTGGIYGVVINQVGKSTEERLQTVEGDMKAAQEDIKNLQGGESGIDKELLDAAIAVAKANAQTLSDSDALDAKVLYPTWKELVDVNYTAEKKYYKFTHEDVLYKTIQDNFTFQAQWIPGQDTESIFARIDESHVGTQEDPIPYHTNMEVYKDKYYTEDGILYKCTRDSGQALHNKASELVGHYFEVVEQ